MHEKYCINTTRPPLYDTKVAAFGACVLGDYIGLLASRHTKMYFPAILPGIRPSAIVQQIADIIIGSVNAVVVGQQVAPSAVTVGISIVAVDVP